MRRHLIYRITFFFIGIALFYAPAAFLVRGLVNLTGSPLCADCHRVCLRMPISWLIQPWMYPTMLKQPVYLIAVLLLPATALFFGPLFCGWLCPAGSLTEFLGKLVPERIKLDLSGSLNPAPIRYGVLAGILIAPFLGGNACCAFCNFAHMQSLVSAAFGNFNGLRHWASFTILTFVFWFFLFGIFMKGGRGWCNFFCPAGALQGLFHWIGARFKLGKAVQIDTGKCKVCGICISECPGWAIRKEEYATINRHSCSVCLDCVHVCPQHAIKYKFFNDKNGQNK